MVKVVFVGGKNAPANPYKLGDIYDLPPRYARFPWFKLESEIAKYPAKPSPAPVSTVPKVDDTEKIKTEVEEAFEEHLAGIGLTMPTEKPLEAVETAELTPLEAKTRNQLEEMTKEELVTFVTEKGGTADMSMLKALLVEAALALQV